MELTGVGAQLYSDVMKHPLSIILTPDLEKYVEEKVKTGQYSSVTHVVSGALEVLRDQERLTQEDVEELRRDIAAGIAQLDGGACAPWDAKALKARLQQELAKNK